MTTIIKIDYNGVSKLHKCQPARLLKFWIEKITMHYSRYEQPFLDEKPFRSYNVLVEEPKNKIWVSWIVSPCILQRVPLLNGLVLYEKRWWDTLLIGNNSNNKNKLSDIIFLHRKQEDDIINAIAQLDHLIDVQILLIWITRQRTWAILRVLERGSESQNGKITVVGSENTTTWLCLIFNECFHLKISTLWHVTKKALQHFELICLAYSKNWCAVGTEVVLVSFTIVNQGPWLVKFRFANLLIIQKLNVLL